MPGRLLRSLAFAFALSAAAPVRADEPPTEAIALAVPHHFARATARERVAQLLEFWHRAHGLQAEWFGDRVHVVGQVLGVSIDAALDVADDTVLAVAHDPGWLWRSKLAVYVRRMLRKYLHPTYQELPESA